MLGAGSSYWDVESILAEEFLVPCVIKEDIAHCGFLETNDRSDSERVLKAETKVDLPFWLATSLKKADVVAVEIPTLFSTVALENIRMDAPYVNLRKKAAFYFENGVTLSLLLKNDELQHTLLRAYGERWKALIQFAKSEGGGNKDRASAGRFFQRLTFIERKLYKKLKQERSDFQHYFAGAFYPTYQHPDAPPAKRQNVGVLLLGERF